MTPTRDQLEWEATTLGFKVQEPAVMTLPTKAPVLAADTLLVGLRSVHHMSDPAGVS